MNHPRRRVLYLTCTEIIADHGIFETQVKSLLKALTQEHGDVFQMHLLSLVPVLRFRKWGVQRVFTEHREAFQAIREDLGTAGVRCRILPLMAAYPFLSMRPLELLLALPLALVQVLRYLRRYRVDLLHCRSYPAGLLAYLTHKLTGTPYIFDPRSTWIEEQVLNGNWGGGSLSYRLWRRLEPAIVRHAAATVVVSTPMAGPYRHHARRVEVIYTTASSSFFTPISSNFSESDRRRLAELRDLSPRHTLLAFVTNRFNKWNDLGHLLKGYCRLRAAFENPRLVLLTRTLLKTIQSEAKAYGIPKDEVWVEGMNSKSVAAALNICHYGLLIRPKSTLSPIVMSVKFAEYLASGLPVLCDDHIGGAAQVIRDYEVGALLTGEDARDRAAIQRVQSNYTEITRRCREVAEARFSVYAHAGRYAQLYQDVLA